MLHYEVHLIWNQDSPPSIYREEIIGLKAANIIDVSEQLYSYLIRTKSIHPASITITFSPA